jgi:hypothetical protein
MRKLVRRRPSPAMIIAVIALVLALTGGAFAAAKQIKLGRLTDGAKNKTVGVGKLTYVTTTTPIPPGTPDEVLVPVSATCPGGLKPIGGGIKRGANVVQFSIADSYPTATGWAGTVENESTNSQTATTIVACAPSRVVTGSPPSS